MQNMQDIIPSQTINKIISKFLINLPKQQLIQSRIGFHFERAYFYYIDTNKQSIQQKDKKNEKISIFYFCQEILKKISCPQFQKYTSNQIDNLIQTSYLAIPVNGIILLNMENTHTLLVESSICGKYGFPKGKINQGESQQHCAIREVKEQIGLHIKVNPNQFVKVQFQIKCRGVTVTKHCKFYISNIEQSCIVSRQYRNQQKNAFTTREILNSKSQIKSIGWYRLIDEIPKLIKQKQFNTASKLAYYQLMKKLLKNKKEESKMQIVNPFQKFVGFDDQYKNDLLK